MLPPINDPTRRFSRPDALLVTGAIVCSDMTAHLLAARVSDAVSMRPGRRVGIGEGPYVS
jgi:hypothetical protein